MDQHPSASRTLASEARVTHVFVPLYRFVYMMLTRTLDLALHVTYESLNLYINLAHYNGCAKRSWIV